MMNVDLVCAGEGNQNVERGREQGRSQYDYVIPLCCSNGICSRHLRKEAATTRERT